MPYKPYWLHRLPEILEAVKGLSAVTIDRPTFESIFQLRRRRAIELMHSLGSRRHRRGYVLDRCALLERLESLNVLTQYRWEEQVRVERVVEQVNGTKANTLNCSNGVHAYPRRLILEFADKAELTTKLLALLRAACDGHGKPPGVNTARDLQYGRFEQAIQAFRKQSLREAEALFARACVGPDHTISTSAETYLLTCRRRAANPFEPSSFDERYTYGVALLNDRRLCEARKQLESALQMNPGADYVYYSLAACFALCGEMTGLYSNLKRAIELQPRNRIAARSDPDFREASHDPSIRDLVDAQSRGPVRLT